MKEREWLDLLETMIDQRGLTGILEDMAGICDAKAEHIEISYGPDDRTAVRWEQAGAVLMAAQEHVNV